MRCLQETHFRFKKTHKLKVKGWQKIFSAYENQKREEVAVFSSDKIQFKPKTVIRDKEGHFVVIKRSIHLEDIPVVNIPAPSIRMPNYREQILTNQKGVRDSTSVSGEDFTPTVETVQRFLRKFKMELLHDQLAFFWVCVLREEITASETAVFSCSSQNYSVFLI